MILLKIRKHLCGQQKIHCMNFLHQLPKRNAPLYWFGLVNGIAALIFGGLSQVYPFDFAGVNAWYKPIKFMLSTLLFSWAMAWYTHYLDRPKTIRIYNWLLIITLGFEVVYIAGQAMRGMASHYNDSSPLYSGLFVLMALAATIASLVTGYIGVLFCRENFPSLPKAYVWGIRLGIFIFVIFALEGFVMGHQMAHSVGISDGKDGLPFLNWSKKVGDLRVAHFIGMHGLQVLPLLAFYVLKKSWLVWLAASFYFGLAVCVLVQALQGQPFLSF